MVPVPAGVVLSYGGYTFGPYVKTKATGKPIPGSGDRTVKYTQWTITVNGWLTQADADAFAAAQRPPLASGLTLDAFMVALRRKLQRHGKPLQYVNKGLGVDLNINNPAGGIRDVAMGPRAGDFNFQKPLGGAPDGCHSCVFDWSISFTIQECANARYNPGPGNFTDVTFTVAYDTDEAGMLTITLNGKLEIPLSLNAAGGLDHQIDEYFRGVVEQPPVGFLRKVHRQLSADRRSCDFTLTDRQIEIAYPDDVIEIDAKHKIRASNLACVKWNTTISATIRLRPGAQKSRAWFVFYDILFQRINQTISSNGFTTVNGQIVPTGIVPPVIEMEEDLFRNSARFSASYFITSNLAKVINASGLWRPVGTDFDRWQGTLLDNAQATLGVLGTTFDRSQDLIIDACGLNTGGAIAVGGAADEEVSPRLEEDDAEGYDTDAVDEFEPIGLAPFADEGTGAAADSGIAPVLFAGPDSNSDPLAEAPGWGTKRTINPASSWIDWTCGVRRIIDYKMIRHKPLSGDATTDTPAIDVTAKDSLTAVANDTTLDSIGFESTVPDIVQRIASPSITLELRGHAIRFGYSVNAPKLISFGGVDAILAHEDVTPTTLAAPDRNKFYRLDWVLTYIIPSAPATISVPANPYLGTDGQQ